MSDCRVGWAVECGEDGWQCGRRGAGRCWMHRGSDALRRGPVAGGRGGWCAAGQTVLKGWASSAGHAGALSRTRTRSESIGCRAAAPPPSDPRPITAADPPGPGHSSSLVALGAVG
jgi:hypothetical protein